MGLILLDAKRATKHIAEIFIKPHINHIINDNRGLILDFLFFKIEFPF